MQSPTTLIVVPCFNEAARLPVAAFREFAAAHPSVGFVFVNDGSTDDTGALVQSLVAASPAQFSLFEHAANQGKAEAVRAGMVRALATKCRYAGYWDADLATPLDEISRFVEVLDEHPERDACFGARVQLLGRAIERRALRHYLGRVFATVASLLLELPVYDTQCGAKLFRGSDRMAALFADPFCVRWTFDVEIIARMRRERSARGAPGPATAIYELPLDHWRDVTGSKVRSRDFLKALVEMFRIWRTYLR